VCWESARVHRTERERCQCTSMRSAERFRNGIRASEIPGQEVSMNFDWYFYHRDALALGISDSDLFRRNDERWTQLAA
ncbi:MAG: hypothetical protein ACR2NM_16880, partial [Bythopirellula sp.]